MKLAADFKLYPQQPLLMHWGEMVFGCVLSLALFYCGCSGVAQCAEPLQAESPTLEAEPFFKPLVDTSFVPQTLEPVTLTPQDSPQNPPLAGRAQRHGEVPVSDAPLTGPTKVLTGKVQTLQQAIDSERDVVDWYSWYLSAREYISQTGGLRCALGTPIKFYRTGKMEALTFDTNCIASVTGRRFPLPPKTSLDALILPVRSGQGPPASPAEIYSRIRINSQ